MTRTALAFSLALLIIGLILAPALHSQEAPAARAAALPVGAIVAWHAFGSPTASPPAGWLPCDGRAIDDPWFVANVGAGKFTPNLNGAAEPASKANPGHPVFLRGGPSSPVDGYGGADSALHTHGIDHRHDIGHDHSQAHRHSVPHSHRFNVRTATDGGTGRGGTGGYGGGTSRHAHDVRGETDNGSGTQTQDATPARSGPASKTVSEAPRPARSDNASPSIVPRHFTVTWLIKVRP